MPVLKLYDESLQKKPSLATKRIAATFRWPLLVATNDEQIAATSISRR
jgi:hypothetical protein